MTREECERAMAEADASFYVRDLRDALRATLEREAAARDAALEEAVRECRYIATLMEAGGDVAAQRSALNCASAVEALKGGAR